MSATVPTANTIPESYDVLGGEALQFNVTAEERFNVEPGRDCFSIVWSSSLPLATAIQRLALLLPDEPAAELTLWLDDDFQTLPGSTAALLQQLAEMKNAPDFWRLDLAEITLTWELGETPPGRIGFLTDVFDAVYITELVKATATATINSVVGQLLPQCTSVAKPLPLPERT